MLWTSRSSVFIFCQESPVDYCHVLCCYVGVLWHCYLLYFKCYLAVNRRLVSFLFCSPFANRASDSGDLYIDFDRNHLIFPVACLVCQVTAMFIIFLPEHAYASHIISCISYMFCIMLLVHSSWLIVVPLLVFLSWVEPGDEFVNEEPVEYAYEDQAFVNSENLQARWPYPRNHFYLCLLVARSFAMPRYLPLAISCLPYCHASL